ncbi:MAG TPA: thioredoxin domain-containing protein, partial [Thermoanaerobaculia bacterium]|nr:thioredoxin domain-containing protein [Thermoanaerobaculia bacterium]
MSNRLAAESSPYLLQHKDNPVDWYPWGEPAFARAREEDRPIFLSIGYSTCHWCHVMERESFENESVAAFLNEHFVSIKVDREERPDVDDIYMTAVQAMTGSGGWPLSVFLTADRKPFYGGTYFPPEDRYGRPGFRTLLAAVVEGWKARRQDLITSADELLAHVRTTIEGLPGGTRVATAPLEAAAAALRERFDRTHGGFGTAPKFPPSMQLELLLRCWLRTREAPLAHMAEKTLEKMAAGGLFDHVGGGFHRYSVDERWLIPHFEKMLYDNAMLARVYLLAGRAFQRPDFDQVARDTLDYLLAEMTPPGGGFCAAQDADSGGEEGTFYVWNPETLAEAVGGPAAPIVAARYGVDTRGNFEGGETVLSIVAGLPDLSREFGKSQEEISAILARARIAMREKRSRRVAPATDDKLLTDWTGLAISAFALAARLLKDARYEGAAREAADRVLTHCVRERTLLHRQRGARAGIPGFASDYANMIEAVLDLYEATFQARYFRAALELQACLDEKFGDPRGGYFFTGAEGRDLPLRPRETLDT